MKKYILFLLILNTSYLISLPISIFKKNIDLDTNNLIQRSYRSLQNTDNYKLLDYSGEDLIVGFIDPNEEITINNDFILNGNIIILNNGILEINSKNFKLNGNINILDNGILTINNTNLKIIQTYPYEKSTILTNNSKISISNSEIQTNNYSWSIALLDSSQYILKDSKITNGFITTALMHNSQSHITNIKTPGEFLCFNSSSIDLSNSDFLLMWLVTPDKSSIDISLPKDSLVNNWSFSDELDSVSGINYSISINNCTNVLWACISETGSHSLFRNSNFRAIGLMTNSSDSVNINGITNNSNYVDKTTDISDRFLKLIDSKVQTWNFYSSKNSKLSISNSVFGEILSQDNSRAYINNSVCDGTGGYVGSFNHSYMQFVESFIKTSFISRDNSVLFAVNSAISSSDINSDESSIMFLANTTFKASPVALDTSVIFNALLNDVKGYTNDKIPVIGSAWIKSGPYNPIKMTKYKVEYTLSDKTPDWQIIDEYSNKEINNNILANWNTASLKQGIYFLHLTLYQSFNDSVNIQSIARLDTNLSPTGIISNKKNSSNLIKIIPNPVSELTTIYYSVPKNAKASIEIYDNNGIRIKTLLSKYLIKGNYTLSYDAGKLQSGIYYCVLNIGNKNICNQKIIVIK